MVKHCGKCLHLDVCKTAETCDGHVPRCKHFMDKTAISEALEKQKPQQPDIEGDGYDPEGNLVYDAGYCPRCRQEYEIEYHTPKYCENCGQALEWGDDYA